MYGIRVRDRHMLDRQIIKRVIENRDQLTMAIVILLIHFRLTIMTIFPADLYFQIAFLASHDLDIYRRSLSDLDLVGRYRSTR